MQLLIAFFLKYLLAPLLMVVLLFLMNGIKNVKQKLSVKNVIIFILLAGLLLGTPGFLAILKDEYVWGGLLINVGMYFVLGLIFLRTVTGSVSEWIGINGMVVGQVLVMLASAILGAWIHYLIFEWQGGMPYGHWAMSNVLWYTVPYLTYLSLKSFHQIPPPLYELWYTGQSSFNRGYWDNFDTFTTTPVKVKIKRQRGDNAFSTFTVRLQDGISIGDWFNWMIEDQNKRTPGNAIGTDGGEHEVGWLFYTARWISYPLFIRILDPQKNRLDNKIKKNQVIYVKRVTVIDEKQYEED